MLIYFSLFFLSQLRKHNKVPSHVDTDLSTVMHIVRQFTLSFIRNKISLGKTNLNIIQAHFGLSNSCQLLCLFGFKK